MKFWPLSTLASSPLMHPTCQAELSQVGKTCQMSPHALQACGWVAHQTEACNDPRLVIIESVGAQARQAYTSYPEWDEWFKLERVNAFQADNGGVYIIIDALH